MTKNMGTTDRLVRAVIGAILLIAAFSAGWSMLWTIIAVVVGAALLGTAAVAHCPPYKIFGINTCKSSDA